MQSSAKTLGHRRKNMLNLTGSSLTLFMIAGCAAPAPSPYARAYYAAPTVIVAPQPDTMTHYLYSDEHSTNETHITSNSTVHIITNHPEALNPPPPAEDTSTSSDDVQRAMYMQHQQDQLDQQNAQQAEPPPPEEAQPSEEPASDQAEQSPEEPPAPESSAPATSDNSDNNQ